MTGRMNGCKINNMCIDIDSSHDVCLAFYGLTVKEYEENKGLN